MGKARSAAAEAGEALDRVYVMYRVQWALMRALWMIREQLPIMSELAQAEWDQVKEVRNRTLQDAIQAEGGAAPGVEAVSQLVLYDAEWVSAGIQNAHLSVETASLVFAHSIIDAIALDCLRVTTIAEPDRWARRLAERKVSLCEAREKPYPNLLAEAIGKLLEEADTWSLPKKVSRLFEVCKPPPNWNPGLKRYTFDPIELERIDGIRHEYVHRQLLPTSHCTFYKEVQYLRRTSLFLILLVQYHCNVKMDQARLKRLLQAADKNLLGMSEPHH